MESTTPIYLTAHISGVGYHGHQLKDLLSARAIAKLFNITYVHTPYTYLDFSAAAYRAPCIKTIRNLHPDLKIKRIQHKPPGGHTGLSLKRIRTLLEPPVCRAKKKREPLLIILDCGLNKAIRVHPCQTIQWYKDGEFRANIFEELTEELHTDFKAYHHLREPVGSPGEVNIAMHINRGKDFRGVRKPKGGVKAQAFGPGGSCRYMFPLSYYKNIILQLEKALSGQKYKIRIYTEKLNSQSIIDAFEGHPNTILCIGSCRDSHHGKGHRLHGDQKNYSPIHDIFYQFVVSDILVASNSSFSITAAHFRGSKPTIYHPHAQCFNLPEDRYLATDINGDFKWETLNP